MIRTTAGLLLAWTLLACDASDAAPPPAATELGVCDANGVPEHIRSFDCRLAKIIASGLGRSETFRQVIERVGRLNGMVYIVDARYYVQSQTVSSGALLHTAMKAGNYRILYLVVAPQSGDSLICVLARELQHAVEVLESDATTEAEIDQLFERISVHATTGVVDTPASLDVERAVARELSAVPGS
jgi:hypothetical protein